MDLSNIKKSSPNKNIYKKVISLIASMIIIIISFMLLSNVNKDAKNTIKVLMIKDDKDIPAYTMITEDNIKEYDLIKKEYSEDMFLAEDKDEILNKYSKNFIRKDTVIYKDQIIDEIPQRNEWLYEVEEEKEVLTIPYDYLECGGDILVPGDRVRIRISYNTEEKNEQSLSDNPNTFYAETMGKTIKTEILFESIVVKEMIHSNGHSIKEVYKKVMRLDEDNKQIVMKSEEFLKNIQPKALVLEGTKDQINKYAKMNLQDGKKFLVTILSRTGSEIVLDQLPTLEKEVELWIENKKE